MDLWQPIAAVAGAIPCFMLSNTLFRVWRDPESVEEGRWVRFGVAILIMEFLVIHSGGMIGGFGQGGSVNLATLFLFIVPMYVFFAWAISFSMGSKPLMWSFLALIAGRLTVVFFDSSGEGLDYMIQRTVVSLVIYFPLVFLSITDLLPKLGMADPKYARAIMANGTTGTWAEHPHRAIGAAAIYFFLLGIAELAYLSWAPL